jgi:hypothetical protein
LLTHEYNKRIEQLRKEGWDQFKYQQINSWFQHESSKKGIISITLPDDQPSVSAYAAIDNENSNINFPPKFIF